MIPKVIHYCWFGNGNKNDLMLNCIASWKKYCPDYQIIEWNESNYDVFSHSFTKDAYEARKWAFVSDYARLDILNRYGGIYLDTDVELISSLDPFLQYDFYAGFENDEFVAFGLGFGSVAGHPLLKNIMDCYDQISFPDNDFDRRMISCPKIQTKALKEYGLICNNQNQVISNCHIFSSEYFCPMSFQTGKTVLTKNTVSIHHFDMSWFPDNDKALRLREWRFVKVLGPSLGKKVFSVVSFPGKLIKHTKEGRLIEYLRLLTGKKREKE